MRALVAACYARLLRPVPARLVESLMWTALVSWLWMAILFAWQSAIIVQQRENIDWLLQQLGVKYLG